ncbi:DNA-deoxyinosine glycosylase [Ramlibacter henchirensis]|uniref:DNA-deoxyinosine glycosylase n=1 Tax=Ramlibacter henchirensis TaxID=204072 RepID=A0A4Z0BWI7_9BURK|nr:DNA-deoxyinosine glycosylase [Ramlibacter henchirensis]TFZ03082.1 DNA-deoxyinosine glycosylase [Ramlibacter henchirensis]
MEPADSSGSREGLRSRSFHVISRSDARILVLGTLPGERSLACGEYYAHPQNRFWMIVGEVLGFDPLGPYETRVKQLFDHRIALWDVCAAAERPGSLDASIRSASVMPNDFSAFFAGHPGIVRVCFNGQHAAKLFQRLVRETLPTDVRSEWVTLPSTSPANASVSLEEKRRAWSQALLS